MEVEMVVKLDRGDGRDDMGRFVKGGKAASECGEVGFWAALESIQERYPNAVNSLGNHITTRFMHYLKTTGRL